MTREQEEGLYRKTIEDALIQAHNEAEVHEPKIMNPAATRKIADTIMRGLRDAGFEWALNGKDYAHRT